MIQKRNTKFDNFTPLGMVIAAAVAAEGAMGLTASAVVMVMAVSVAALGLAVAVKMLASVVLKEKALTAAVVAAAAHTSLPWAVIAVAAVVAVVMVVPATR